MEEQQIKFLKAQGRKNKRYASSLTFEGEFSNDIYAVNGDTLIFTISTPNQIPEGKVVAKIILAGITNIKSGDKIKIETELVPSITKVTLIKDIEKQ